MLKIKKCVVIFLGAALLIALLAGAVQTKEITYMTYFTTLEAKRAAEIAIEVFERKNPGINIKWIPVPFGDYMPKLLTMIAGGVGPDAFFVFPTFVPEVWHKGVVYPLNELIAEDTELNWEDIMIKKTLTGKMYNGEIVGLPQAIAASCYFYNKDTFQKAGLTEPRDIYYRGNWNWDTYMALGPKLSKDLDGDGVMDEFTNVGSFWWNVFNNAGADMYNEDGTKCTLDTPEVMQALQFMVDEVKKGLVPPPQFEAAKVGMSFETGKVAMRSIWVNFMSAGAFQNLPFNWGVVMPYYGPTGPEYANAGAGASVCIAKTAQDKALVYKFLKFLTSDEVFLAVLKEPGVIATPIRYSHLKLPEYRESIMQFGQDVSMITDIWEQAGRNGGPRASIAGFFGDQVWAREMNNALRGAKTVEEACRDAAKEIQVALDEKLEE